MYDGSTKTQAIVNEWLTKRGEEPISISTIEKDKERFEELLGERAMKAAGVERRLQQLQRLAEIFERRLAKIPDHHGQAAAAMGMVLLRCVEHSSRLDGSWQGGGLDVNVSIEAKSFGPTPREQYEAGLLTEEQYLQTLKALAPEDIPPQLPAGQESGAVQADEPDEPAMDVNTKRRGSRDRGRAPEPEPRPHTNGRIEEVVDMPDDVEW
jgi:hypothetical protein